MTTQDPIVADVRTAHVTVYEDRAEVTRRCRVRLPGGAAAVALRALSPLIDEARLIARFDGIADGDAQVDDVVVVRRTDVAGADAIEARLLARAEARFDAMMAAGALEEARALMDLDPALPAMKAIGLPELIAHLRGEITRDEAVTRAKAATRQFIKRQLTWLRGQLPHWQQQDMRES